MFISANEAIQRRMYELLDEDQQKLVDHITETMAENPYKLPDLFSIMRFRAHPKYVAAWLNPKEASESDIKWHREVCAFLTQIGYKVNLEIARSGFPPHGNYDFCEYFTVSIEPFLINDNYARITDVGKNLDFPRAKIKEKESLQLQIFIRDNFPGLWGYFFQE